MQRAISRLRTKASLFSSTIILLTLLSGCESSQTKDWWENPAHWSGTVTYTESAQMNNVPATGLNGAPGDGSMSITYNNTEKVIITGAVAVSESQIQLQGSIQQDATLEFTNTEDKLFVKYPCNVRIQWAEKVTAQSHNPIASTPGPKIIVSPDQSFPGYSIQYLRNDTINQLLKGTVNTTYNQTVTGGAGCATGTPPIPVPPGNVANPWLPHDLGFGSMTGHGPWPENLHDHDRPHIVTIVFDAEDKLDWNPAFTGMASQIPVQRKLTWNITYLP